MIISSVHEEVKAWHAEYTIFWNSKYYDFKVNDVEDTLGKEISSQGKLHSGYRAKSNLLSVQTVHNFM